MVTTCWRENSLVKKLLTNPQQFNFFQTVLLWEKVFGGKFPVGHDHAPDKETIRFRVPPSLSFPASDIDAIQMVDHVQSNHVQNIHAQNNHVHNNHVHNNHVRDGFKPSPTSNNKIELSINFLGLIGASGVLPNHYTELLLQRLHAKDNALLDFLDIFHHRTISLFYRAWEKYRFYIFYQRSKDQQQIDSFSLLLKCLLGNGLSKSSNRLFIPDETLIFYSGLMQQPRSAINLERLLQSYFDLPLTIEPFAGEWSNLQSIDCSRIGAQKTNYYNLLGNNVVLGNKIWETTHKFYIKIGALDYHEFKRLLPTGDQLKPLKELTRYYVGINLNFEIKLILKPNEIPPLQLQHNSESCLGWNTWL